MSNTREVTLKNGRIATVDEADYELVRRYKWTMSTSSKGAEYARCRVAGKEVWMHRLILGAGAGRHINAIDGNLLNCCRKNIQHSHRVRDEHAAQGVVGKRFGRLSVLFQKMHRTGNPSRSVVCECSCGRRVSVWASLLNSERVLDCGCADRERISDLESAPLPLVISTAFFHRLQRGAVSGHRRDRQIQWLLTREMLADLFNRQGGRCALTGIQLNASASNAVCTASLDRINPCLHYTLDNVRWVHKTINIMRGCMSDEDFIRWCGLVWAEAGRLPGLSVAA